MPSEPDNKMDNLLKAYAKKRRADAGGSAEMHPATRRMLQAEAAKLRPAPIAAPASWMSALTSFWPRLAFAAAVLLFGGFAAIHFFPGGNTGPGAMQLAKQDSASVGTDRYGEEERLALSRRQVIPNPAKPAAELLSGLADEVKAESSLRREIKAVPEPPAVAERDLADAGKKLKSIESLNRPAPAAPAGEAVRLSTAAAPAAEPAGRIPLPADALAPGITPAESKDKDARGVNEGLAAKGVSGPAQNGLPSIADSKQPFDSLGRGGGGAPVAQPAAAAPGQLAYFSKAAADPQSNDPKVRARFALKPGAARPAAGKEGYSDSTVLANFVVEQSGDQLRVVDGDGSVYIGKVLSEDLSTTKVNAGALTGLAGGRQDQSGPVRATAGAAVGQSLAQANPGYQNAGEPQTTTWNFRVSGTNRTLQQPVTVDGLLFETPATNALNQVTAQTQNKGAEYFRDVQLQSTRPPLLQQRAYPVADSPAQATSATAGPQAYGAQTLNLQNTLRIQGNYRVGTTNLIPLDAVRDAKQP